MLANTPTRKGTRLSKFIPTKRATLLKGIAPVKSFLPNGYGLYDMAGNIWEWCSDWYRPDYYRTLAEKGGIAINPQGPDSPFDPAEPSEKKRCIGAARFFATINIVPATLSARVAKARLTPVPIISAFVA